MEPTINTQDARLFDYSNPSFEGFTVEGLSAALSKLCRFTGHCHWMYSVATHCCIVSDLLPARLAARGLVHDLHEAVMGDINSPLKTVLPDYRKLEKVVEAKLMEWLGTELTPSERAEVKKVDRLVYLAERDEMMPTLPESHREWVEIPVPEEGTEDWVLYCKARSMVRLRLDDNWIEGHSQYMDRAKALLLIPSEKMYLKAEGAQ